MNPLKDLEVGKLYRVKPSVPVRQFPPGLNVHVAVYHNGKRQPGELRHQKIGVTQVVMWLGKSLGCPHNSKRRCGAKGCSFFGAGWYNLLKAGSTKLWWVSESEDIINNEVWLDSTNRQQRNMRQDISHAK